MVFFQDNLSKPAPEGYTILDFTRARHQLDHMQILGTLLPTDNHASTSQLSFLQAGCPSCHPTNSVKALKTSKQTAAKTRPPPTCGRGNDKI